MNRKTISIVLAMILAFALASAAFAENSDHLVNLNVLQPVAVPGAVLQPGTYALRFIDDSRHMARIVGSDGAIVGTYAVIPAYRSTSTDAVEIGIEHLSDSSARIGTWFLPGERLGWSFTYPDHRTTVLAKSDSSIVVGN